MKWVDNHKGVFTVSIKAVSSVHAQVSYSMQETERDTSIINLCCVERM